MTEQTSRGRDPPRRSRRGSRAARRERVARVSGGTRPRRDARYRETTTRKSPSSSRPRLPGRRRRRTPRSSRPSSMHKPVDAEVSIRDASERVPGTERRAGSRPRAARVRYARWRQLPRLTGRCAFGGGAVVRSGRAPTLPRREVFCRGITNSTRAGRADWAERGRLNARGNQARVKRSSPSARSARRRDC